MKQHPNETLMTQTPPSLKKNALPWILWGMASFFYCFQYIVRVFPGVMTGPIMQKFCIDAGCFGDFSGAYYLGYALMHIPLGLMLDRYPLKYVVSGTVLISVLGVLPLVLGSNWTLSILGRFLVGAGSSGAILSVFKIIRLYFPEALFSRLLGFSVMIGLTGAIYGGRPIDMLAHHWGWEETVLLLTALGALLAFFLFILIPGQRQSATENSLAQELRHVLRQKTVWTTALLGALMVGPLEGFADVWSVKFLEQVYGMPHEAATTMPAFLFVGMGLGAPLLATLAEKMKAYSGVILTSAVAMTLLFGMLLMAPWSPWQVSLIFFLLGIFSAYQVLVLTMNSLNVARTYSGLVTAFTNMIIMAFGAVFHFAISRLMTLYWDGHMLEGVPQYDALSFRMGLSVIPFALIIAFVGFWRQRPGKKCS